MRWTEASVLAVCLVIAGPLASATADPKTDIRAAYTQWDAAFNRGDAKAIAAAYMPDAKLLPPTHAVTSGPAEIEKFFAGLHANGVTGHKLELIDAGGDGKIVFGAANWSAQGKDKDGKPTTFKGIATHVFERQPDNSLKLKLHTFN